MGPKALKGNMVNAFKGTSMEEIVALLMNADPFLRLGIYSGVVSSLLSGWY